MADSEEEKGEDLYSQGGVFVHTTMVSFDEDALNGGSVFLTQSREGVFIEWKADPNEKPQDTEWAVVDKVSYKASVTGTETVSVNTKKQNNKYKIRFNLADLKSFKRSKPRLGWSYLIFILNCGTTYPALHFHKGGTKEFIKQLEKFLHVKKSMTDGCLYLVNEHDPEALSKSFDELNLFEDQSKDIVSSFLKDPYTATFSGFSKVTKLLSDTFHPAAHYNHPVALLDPEDAALGAANNQDEPGFEIITKPTTVKLIDRPVVQRISPLTSPQWSRHMDEEGCIIDEEKLKEVVFRGGVEPEIRTEVWKFLLDYYSWDSTYHSRANSRKKKVDDYFRMKLQWKSVSADQEERFSTLKERKNLIEKDVHRTDRTHVFFQGEDNPHIEVLYGILMTYCMYNFDLGYVQGMSDLLAPILVVMENEVDAFWCFAGFMEIVRDNFHMDQLGMKKQLHSLSVLLQCVDPALYNYLKNHDSDNMYFCFRWLLIHFKREFSFSDIMRLWEVLWTGKMCPNFHLMLALAILDTEKNTLMENNFGFTEILKHINDISGDICMEETLCKAEGIYLQLKQSPGVPEAVKEILGFVSDENMEDSDCTPTSETASEKTGSSNIPQTSDDNSIEMLAEGVSFNQFVGT